MSLRSIRRRLKVPAPAQQELFKSPGGKRPRAGRPPNGKRAGSPHKRRPVLKDRHPVHVVLRVVPEMGNLRKRDIYKAVRWATLTAAARENFRIVHLSIQHNHVHLLVEAEDRMALARGMQGFQISAAKLMNAAISARMGLEHRRRGQVFADRYHAEIIDSPRRARHALSYVLNNWRKHKEDRSQIARTWLIDPFSSAITFPHWKEREHEPLLWRARASYDPLIVYQPRTWLLREAWKRHGLISFREVPGQSVGQRAAR